MSSPVLAPPALRGTFATGVATAGSGTMTLSSPTQAGDTVIVLIGWQGTSAGSVSGLGADWRLRFVSTVAPIVACWEGRDPAPGQTQIAYSGLGANGSWSASRWGEVSLDDGPADVASQSAGTALGTPAVAAAPGRIVITAASSYQPPSWQVTFSTGQGGAGLGTQSSTTNTALRGIGTRYVEPNAAGNISASYQAGGAVVQGAGILVLLPAPAPLAITTEGPLAGTAGQAGVWDLAAQGGYEPHASWDAASLPPGLDVRPFPPALVGTPEGEGTWQAELTVTDRRGFTDTALVEITIAAAPPPPEPRPPAFTRPAVLPADWTFWADTIVGGHPLGPVPATAFNCGRALSGWGTGSVTVPASSSALPAERLLRLWSWRLWCLYDGEPYWCGVPTGIADAGEASATLTLTEITGYLEKRVWDLGPPNVRFNQVEQTEIARQIAQPVEDVGLSIVTEPGPGVLRDREYELLESDHRGQLLVNLTEVGQAENQAAGPQFRTEYYLDAGRPRARLRIAYPRVGRPTGLGMTVPGEVTEYGAAWDADGLRTRTYAAGELPEDAAEDAPRPVVMVDRPQPDLPRLDMVDDYPSTWLTSTLRERANTAAAQYASPALELTAAGRTDAPELVGYQPGDDVTVRVTSPLLPGGLDATGQLLTLDIDAAASSAAWSVAITLPPPKPRASLDDRLDRLDLIVRSARRRRLALLP